MCGAGIGASEARFNPNPLLMGVSMVPICGLTGETKIDFTSLKPCCGGFNLRHGF